MIDLIRKTVEAAVKSMGVKALEVLIERPKDVNHGDYSTNVALAAAKQLGKNPREVAEEIVEALRQAQGKQKFIEKIEVAGPGFINFYLSKDYFVDQLKNIDEGFGKVKKPFFSAKKVIVEYTDPNPFKKFHIGHLSNNAIGESLSRIFEFRGDKVKRANYQGDVGMHVAKSIWGRMENPNLDWGEAYAYGTIEYEDSENTKKKIEEINEKIYSKSDEDINKLYNQGKRETLADFENIYKKLNTKFDYSFFESKIADFGKRVVKENIGNVFEVGEGGAIVFRGEKFGLHTRVFINSKDLPIYEAKELGLAKIKYDKCKYDGSIIITGNEVTDYFKVVIAAMSQIFPDLAQKTKHIGHGMLRLPEGKMSSRTGNVIAAEDLINEVKKMVLQKMVDRDLPDKETVAEMVAIGAIKYSILKQSIGSDVIFDFEKSISFEGDSGPYLQYSYARANSVLEKAKSVGVKALVKNVPTVGQLEKLLIYFPGVVEKAGKTYEPHIITTYLTELAHEFNNYYAHNQIINAEDEFSPYKVALTQAFSHVMKNGLWLLGIQAPEKM